MNLKEAIAHVEDLGAEEIRIADIVFMGGAVLHVLTKAVMNGVELKTPADVRAWLSSHTGLEALRRFR
jgi:hypothetical protein